jgi:hypothetical protein
LKNTGKIVNTEKRLIQKYSTTLLLHYNKKQVIPDSRIIELNNSLKQLTKKEEFSIEDLESYSKSIFIESKGDSHSLGVLKNFVGENIDDLDKIDDFAKMWRIHFKNFLK